MTQQNLKIKWEKNVDFLDNTPRYSIQGLDTSNSLYRLHIGITSKRRRIVYDYFMFYTPYLYDMHTESQYADQDLIFRRVVECKKYIENLLPIVLAELNIDLYSTKYWDNL